MKYRYQIVKGISLKEVEYSLLLAVMAVEGIFGRSQVKLDAAFRLDRKKRCCTIDGDTEIGYSVAKIFTAFLTYEFGERAFEVERIPASRSTREGTRDTA